MDAHGSGHRGLTAAAVVVAALLFVRLGGYARAWLSAPWLALALVVLVVAARTIARPGTATAPGVSPGWRDWFHRHHFSIGLVCVIALTLAIRLPHINADLGHTVIDIDEARLASNVRDYFLTGQIGHESVEHYPGVVFWMMAGASLLAYLRALLDGSISHLQGMSVEMFTASGRLLSAWIAVGIVTVTALLGRRLAGAGAGLIAASVVAVVRMSVDVTTLVRNDPGQVLFVVLAVYVSLVAYRSERWTWTLAAGVLAGIATGIKYTSLFAMAPVLIAASMDGTWTSRWSRVSAALLGFVLATGATNHFIWADFPNFLGQIAEQVRVSRGGASENAAAFHLYLLATVGPGWVLLLLAAGYGAWGLGTGRAEAWIFWSFPILYSWFTTQSLTQFVRWVLPLLPFVSVAGAAGLMAVVRAIAAWDGWRQPARAPILRPVVLSLVVIAALATPLWAGVVNFSRRWSMPTHEVVERWVNERAAAHSVLAQHGTLVFDETRVRVHRVPSLRDWLRGGLYSRLATDWIVVSEFDMSAAEGLDGLTRELRVVAGQSFGGTTGLDYDVYSTRPVPRVARGGDLRLTAPEAAPLLGHEWDMANQDGPGFLLPAGGAHLYIPPVLWRELRVEFDLGSVASDVADASAIQVEVDGAPVRLSKTTRGASTLVAGVARVNDSYRMTTIRLSPGREIGTVRVVRFAFGPP